MMTSHFEKPTSSALSLALGVGVGVIHHLLLQWPVQASLFMTIQSFCAENLAFIVFTYWNSPGSASQIPQLFGLFLSSLAFTALFLKLIYNVYFRHRGIPSKFSWAATDLTYWNVYQKGQSHKQIEYLHKTMGDVVRIQPNHISFNSLSAVEAIHGVRTQARKGDLYSYVMRLQRGSPLTIFSETDKARHGFLRRTANPLFSQTFLRELEPTIKAYYRCFIDGIAAEGRQNNGVVNITKWIDHLAFDISGALSLGEDFKALESTESHEMISRITGKWTSISKVFGIPWIVPLQWTVGYSRNTKETNDQFETWTTKAIEKTLSNQKSGQKSILTALLRASDPESGAKLTFPETIASSTGFIIAAADTTAVSLTFTMYHCLANPRVWQKLRDEIRPKFNTAEEITGQSTSSLEYLEAVIHEGTRLRPAAPSNLIRESPPEGMMVAGHFIPGKTLVSTPTWTILHDERHFSSPHSFIPERWLPQEQGEHTCNKKAYLPFSTGLRGCIGRPLAMLEMRLLVASFVWHFDAQLANPEEPLFEDRFVARRGPLEIKITPVDRMLVV